jgi:hypothetical protein
VEAWLDHASISKREGETSWLGNFDKLMTLRATKHLTIKNQLEENYNDVSEMCLA